MIDNDGYRPNVGIILSNVEGKVFWAKRIGQNAWQFPQGGIQHNEDAEEAMYRELHEEVGLRPADVSIICRTNDWLRYQLPKHLLRHNSQPLCIGQKQQWFLLRMECEEHQVIFDATGTPEFDRWRWVDYWHPLEEVVFFKRDVYQKALDQFAATLFPSGPPPLSSNISG